MNFFSIGAVFLSGVLAYVVYNSYGFQLFLHKRRVKKSFIDDFVSKVKGVYVSEAYFASAHRLVPKEEYKSYSNRQKLHFSKCYNVVTFKTQDASWEFFFHLVREGLKFSELMSLRVFPKHNKIRSEGNVEKNYSRLNIFTNNRYLTEILENQDTEDYLKWLIRHNGDILIISHNNLHFKIFLKGDRMSVDRLLDMVKAIHTIKNKIYRDNILEY